MSDKLTKAQADEVEELAIASVRETLKRRFPSMKHEHAVDIARDVGAALRATLQSKSP